MKKPTMREMIWIGKGVWKERTYRSITAKATDALFVTQSDENFHFEGKIQTGNFSHGLIVTQLEKTYISVDLRENEILVHTVIAGFGSTVTIKRENTQEIVSFSLDRKNEEVFISVQGQQVCQCNLPGSKNSIGFGFFYQENQYYAVTDVVYQRQSKQSQQ